MRGHYYFNINSGIGKGFMGLIVVAVDRVRLQGTLNVIMNLRVP